MSEILSRTVFETCLADQSEAPWEEEVRMLLAHDAALRAEVERLRKALGYITDISEANADRAIVEMKRIAHEALDSAPADEEGRDE